MRPLRVALFSGLVVLASCGPADEAALLGESARAARDGSNDEGTRLTATASASQVSCEGRDGAAVALAGTVTTTGSKDSVVITASVDGGAATQVGTIEPQDFSSGGREKSATYSVTLFLANGTHSVQLCFTQSGAQGRFPKQVCAAPVEVVVECACGGSEVFGNLVGNPRLGGGNGPAHIPVHVRGAFGASPSLTISGPGYHHAALLRRAGDSCTYQYNWNPGSAAGAGTYTFSVAGGGKSFQFTAQLR